MQLPAELKDGIRDALSQVDSRKLTRAAQRLSDSYRAEDFRKPVLSDDAGRLAYLAVRMPATLAAITAALQQVSEQDPAFRPGSLLDLGAGPGTTGWAASELFPSLRKIVFVEGSSPNVELGRRLAAASKSDALRSAEWRTEQLQSWAAPERFDLVTASYAVGELPMHERISLLRRAWEATAGVLVILEPGTRRGFQTIAALRAELIGTGAALIAPCPHHKECPMLVAGDWCHFAARVERTAEHRRLKGGELGHEDEKFSFVAATRLGSQHARERIVRHPLRRSGYTKLVLCTADGLKNETVTRSNKPLYRAAKKAEWGSPWPPESCEDGC